jgi:hypothetical protein
LVYGDASVRDIGKIMTTAQVLADEVSTRKRQTLVSYALIVKTKGNYRTHRPMGIHRRNITLAIETDKVRGADGRLRPESFGELDERAREFLADFVAGLQVARHIQFGQLLMERRVKDPSWPDFGPPSTIVVGERLVTAKATG